MVGNINERPISSAACSQHGRDPHEAPVNCFLVAMRGASTSRGRG